MIGKAMNQTRSRDASCAVNSQPVGSDVLPYLEITGEFRPI